MQTRYRDPVGGFRLDTGETGATGPAVDICRLSRPPVRDLGFYRMWVQDEADNQLTVDLSIENIHDLRNWCSAVLVAEGHERYERVAVPT